MENNTDAMDVACLTAVAKDTVAVETHALGKLGPGMVRVKTERSMVSTGTELHRIQATHTMNKPFPCKTGYITIGTVVGVGDGVESVALGQRVLSSHGHLAYGDVPVEKVTSIPDGVESRDAVCTSLLGISIRGVRAGNVRLGSSVAVFGQGVIGLYATHLAHAAGACPLIAVDPVPARRELALSLGADVVIDPFKEDTAKRIHEVTGSCGVDAAIESTATARVVASLPAVTAREGVIVILGGVHGTVDLDLYTHVQKSNQTIVGCGSPYAKDAPFNTDAANQAALLQMMAGKRITPGKAVTHEAPYTQGPEMYRMLIEEKDKAVGVQFLW